jgi:HEPN domain-containing protein
MNDVLELVGDYMFSRYPDVSASVPFELYDEETATSKVKTAKKIFDSLSERINKIED